MANLSITSRCNRACDYCFARPARGTAPAHDITDELFERSLDFIQSGSMDQVRLLGGEPTLHPSFVALVDKAIGRGLRVLVFTHGLVDERALEFLGGIPEDRLAVLVNCAPLDDYDDNSRSRLLGTFERLGPRVTLGYNIARPSFDLRFLRRLIDAHGLARRVRLGLAHPSVGGANKFLHPHHYAAVGRRLADTHADMGDVRFEFDCGFVPCMFPPDALDAIGGTKQVGPQCGPIPDLLADGSIVPCYPLANLLRLSLPDGADPHEARDAMFLRLSPYRRLGIYAHCDRCFHRERGRCSGGCLAQALRRLRSGAAEVALPPIDAKPMSQIGPAHPGERPAARRDRWLIPYIDQPAEFWHRVRDEFGDCGLEVYAPLPIHIIGSGRPAQPADRMQGFLREAILPVSVLANPITLPALVAELAPRVVEALKRLAGETRLAGVTVSNLDLARRIRQAMPDLSITASVLMDISQPLQTAMVRDVFDGLVPSSRIMRDRPALRALRSAFAGRLRLIVNEACISGCPFRTQHFVEMNSPTAQPLSLCDGLLGRQPWLRLTGAWVLPQHLHLYDGLYDELKLAGRVTLRQPERYLDVLRAYVRQRPLLPHQIGGGPASPLAPIRISEAFYSKTLDCGHQCHQCSLCRDYWCYGLTAGDRQPTAHDSCEPCLPA